MDRITALEAKEEMLKAALAEVTHELDWARDGLKIYGSPTNGSNPAQASPVTETVPSTEAFEAMGTKPKLRQAILRVMLDREPSGGHEATWQLAAMMDALHQRGWGPNGKNAENIVRHMMGDMVKRGQLTRPVVGAYMLSPAIRAGELDAGEGS